MSVKSAEDMEKSTVAKSVPCGRAPQDRKDSRNPRPREATGSLSQRPQNEVANTSSSSGYGRQPRWQSNPKNRVASGGFTGKVAGPYPNRSDGRADTRNHKGVLKYSMEDTISSRKGAYSIRSSPQWNRHNAKWTDAEPGTFYNKEQFIQANCQFVVANTADLCFHLIDPDVIVEWSTVEQVRIMSHEVPQCPICIYPPTAPHMTRCGHIYCWACARQYITYENEEASKKCAICCEHMYLKDLKSVIAKSTHHFIEGDTISMILMRRDKGFSQAVPVGHSRESNSPLSLADGIAAKFAKILVATKDDLHAILAENWTEMKASLSDVLATAEATELLPHLRFLIKEVETQMRELKGEDEDRVEALPVTERSPQGAEAAAPLSSLVTSTASSVTYRDAFSEDEEEAVSLRRLERQDSVDTVEQVVGVLEPPPACSEERSQGVRRAKKTSTCEEDAHYFYQAEDGQHIYLHSVNWQCLAEEYPSIDLWPRKIEAKILQVDNLTMSAAIRKRYRYLSHLPLTCALSVVELDMGPPLVSRETLARFSGPLRKRAKERKEMERYDRMLTKKKEREENKFNHLEPGVRRIASAMGELQKIERDGFDENDFVPLSGAVTPAAASAPPQTPSGGQRSFAETLKTRGAAPLNKPTPPPAATSGIRPSASWCTFGVPRNVTEVEDQENDSEGELMRQYAPPSRQLGATLGSLVEAQLSQRGNGRTRGKKGRRATNPRP